MKKKNKFEQLRLWIIECARTAEGMKQKHYDEVINLTEKKNFYSMTFSQFKSLVWFINHYFDHHTRDRTFKFFTYLVDTHVRKYIKSSADVVEMYSHNFWGGEGVELYLPLPNNKTMRYVLDTFETISESQGYVYVKFLSRLPNREALKYTLNFIEMIDNQKLLIFQSDKILEMLKWAEETGNEGRLNKSVLCAFLRCFTFEQFFKFFTSDRAAKGYFRQDMGIGKLAQKFATLFVAGCNNTFGGWRNLVHLHIASSEQRRDALKNMSALARHEADFEILAKDASNESQIQLHALEALRMIRLGGITPAMKVA